MHHVIVILPQPKRLRRLVQQTFQGYSSLKQDQCMARFFSTLAQCYSYTQESFACRLVVSSCISCHVVKLIVAPF